MLEKEKYSNLINKYLEGRLEPQEVRELKEWLENDKANRRLLNQVKSNWMPEKGSDETLEQASREMRYRIQQNQALVNGFAQLEKPKKKLLTNVIRVAAIFIVGVLLTQALHMTVFAPPKGQSNYCSVDADRGQKSKLTLPDGTRVWLNSESKIQFSTEGFLANRQVKLNGEAYFDVQHNDKKPFVVVTNDYNIEVLGTEFNVMAYEDLERTETALVEGKVKIKKGGKELDLKPGQKAVFEANRLSINTIDVEIASSWKRNELRYDAISFRELVFSLERWYDVQISLADTRLYDVKYSGVFKNDETIEEVLEALKYTTSINYKKKGLRQYEISFKE